MQPLVGFQLAGGGAGDVTSAVLADTSAAIRADFPTAGYGLTGNLAVDTSKIAKWDTDYNSYLTPESYEFTSLYRYQDGEYTEFGLNAGAYGVGFANIYANTRNQSGSLSGSTGFQIEDDASGAYIKVVS